MEEVRIWGRHLKNERVGKEIHECVGRLPFECQPDLPTRNWTTL